MQSSLNTIQKIALLLVSLGPERSAQIMAHLDQEQITRIVREIASLGKVANGTKRAVLREFRSLVAVEEERAQSVSFAEQVLDQALGQEKARDMMKKISPAAAPSTPSYLATLTPSRAAELIGGEPVHIIALLLASLSPDKAAAILQGLPAPVQAPVALQLATTTPPSPELRKQLEQAVAAKARRYQHEELASGRAVLTTVFNREENHTPEPPGAPEPMAAPVLAAAPAPALATPAPAAASEPSAADEATNAAFTEVLTTSSSLRALFEGLDNHDLGLALSGMSDALQAACLRALSFRRRMAVQGVLRSQQPVRLRDIAAAQERVLAAIRRPGAVPEGELVHV
ncbi:MAG: FliG C-terminal domain-containing protein [Armatimonadota bacterium]